MQGGKEDWDPYLHSWIPDQSSLSAVCSIKLDWQKNSDCPYADIIHLFWLDFSANQLKRAMSCPIENKTKQNEKKEMWRMKSISH